MKGIKALWLGLALLAGASGAFAQDQQFIPILSYRVGPYAAGGSGYFGGAIDYFNLINLTGGINGVKIFYEECETEYNAARGVECYERLKKKNGGASTVEPLSTGIAYGLLDRVAQDKIPMTTFGYGSANSADGRVFEWVFPARHHVLGPGGGDDRLPRAESRRRRQAQGQEDRLSLPRLGVRQGSDPGGRRAGGEARLRAGEDSRSRRPGNTQESQWLQIRQAKPDYVILWGFGVMNPVALKAAAKVGYPRDKMLGVWWAGSEEDVIPAGDAAKGYVSAAFSAPGTNFPVMQDIKNKVYGAGKGNLEDPNRLGNIYDTRGVVYGIIIVEAIRTAQAKYGKGKVMTPEQVRWGLEHLNLTEARIKELGAAGMFPPIKTSCVDHEGSGMVKFQEWDGKGFKPLTPYMAGDRDMVRKMVEESAAKYAAEKKMTPRDCGKEG